MTDPAETTAADPDYSMLAVRLHPLTLAFSGPQRELEAAFQESYFASSLDHVRRCMLYAILFFSVFGVLDVFVFPEQRFPLWLIRYGIVCPLFLAGLFFSYSSWYRRCWQPTNGFFILVTGFAYVAMVVITPAPEAYFYGVGTIFCVFFGYTFIRARFITASIAGLFVLAGYQATLLWLMDTSPVIQLISGSHFLGINILGMLICYSMESHQRRSFFLNHLLKEEKKKVEVANRSLERRVEQRTAALQRINRDLHAEVLERKQAEARVRSSHAQLASILDSISSDIHVSDMETRKIVLANQHMKETYGENLVGKKCHAVIYGSQTTCRECKKPKLVGQDGQVSHKSHSWEEKNPINGRWYLNVARAIDWEDDRTVQLHVATDITTLKEMETRLQRAQKMEAIGTLAGGVAHDLNNILAGLVGYPEILLLEMPEEGKARTLLETIQESGEKAAAIVQDLLTLARRGVAVSQTMELNKLVKNYLDGPEMARLQSHHAGLTIRSDLSDDLPPIVGSPVHLEKSVMNLVTNAAEAMPEGGEISLTTYLRTLEQPIHGFETIPPGDYAILRVADTGIGIAASDLEQIFEPFYTNKKMGRSGTGLGMAVVWGTVKDHHGFINTRSIQGQGTVFELFFPVTLQEGSQVHQEEAELSVDNYAGAGERVLVVDDIKEQRNLAAFMLERLGYQVDTVGSGPEAIAHLDRQPADVVVLDMSLLPDMDGLETYRNILKRHPGQKAIITSGFSETQRVLEAQRLGAGRYIKKPYRLEQIGLALYEQLHDSEPSAAKNAPFFT